MLSQGSLCFQASLRTRSLEVPSKTQRACFQGTAPESKCACTVDVQDAWPQGVGGGETDALVSFPTRQEIPLSEILAVEPAQDFSLVPSGANPHCFEIITAKATYFVGENGAPSNSGSHQHGGDGLEQARAWETAIRQALMPVILQGASNVQGQAPHRECLEMPPPPPTPQQPSPLGGPVLSPGIQCVYSWHSAGL